MPAVATVSRKIPTPRPRPTEVREESMLLLLSRLSESWDHAANRYRGLTYRQLSAARSSPRHWHHLVRAYSNSSEIKLANPEIQPSEREIHRPQHAGRARHRAGPGKRDAEGPNLAGFVVVRIRRYSYLPLRSAPQSVACICIALGLHSRWAEVRIHLSRLRAVRRT